MPLKFSSLFLAQEGWVFKYGFLPKRVALASWKLNRQRKHAEFKITFTAKQKQDALFVKVGRWSELARILHFC